MNRTLMLTSALAVVVTLSIATAQDPAPTSRNRVFEMRTYHANEGKFDALQKRFREHTHALFQKHGMTPIGYWVPQDEKDGKGRTLVYILAFPSREAAKKSWAAFGTDPEWQRVKSETEREGRLVAKVESVYLDPTDYSPTK